MLNRRQFLGVVGAATSWPAVGLRASPIGEWGSPVFDVHLHMRGQTAANVAHLDGAGITSANLLTRAAGSDQVCALQTAAPARFTWFCSADPSTPEGVEALTGSVRSGARGHIVNGQLMAIMIDDDAASSNNWSGQFGIEIEATTKVSVRNIWVKTLS